ncbi:MAG: YbaB/EbfC family nucleoid-associated protein [bacterium]|nr:YbaB/EbfC family nucleoid-associated protein [bacterium]
MEKRLDGVLKQVQKIGAEIIKLQEELKNKTVTASTGGGMVSVTANGKREIMEVKIDKEVVNPEDIEMLEDLVLSAVNEALRRAQDLVQNEISKLSGGINIPQGLLF